MPRKTRKRLPKMGRHSSGQARITLNGRVHYLGQHGTLEAQKAYTELVERWEANGRQALEPAKTVVQLATVGDAIDAYLGYLTATGRYTKQGKPTSQRQTCERALSEFRKSHGDLALASLASQHVILHRDGLEKLSHLTRSGINRKMQHVRACLKWAKHRAMITRDQWLGIADIDALSSFECGGRDRKMPKRPVSLEEVEAVASVASAQVARIMRFQAAVGCRPGEAVAMRWSDISPEPIEVDGVSCRVYRVANAKNDHRESGSTTYCLPPSVIDLIGTPGGPGRHVFTSPVSGGAYSVASYRNAVAAACRRAKVSHFSPHCIRHGFVTRAAKRFGVLAAASAANHSSTVVTQSYLHRDKADGYRCVVGLLDGTA